MAEIDYNTEEEVSYDPDQEFDPNLEDATPTSSPSFLAKNRLFVIATVIILVFILGAVLFGLRLSSKKPKRPVLKNPQAAQQEKTTKKKSKKIKYIKLYDLEAGAAAKVLQELSFAEIAFSTEQKGKNYAILVDQKRVDDARNLLAIKGLPAGGIKGYDLLDDSQTLGVTEFDKRVRFLRALSGELEKAIIQFDAIENAKVQIVLPEQRLFAVTQPPVTSSILVRKIQGAIMTDDIVFSIIQLVANAVENLQPENVSVIDTEGKVLSEGIFERMASKSRRSQTTSRSRVSPRLLAQGQPVIPNIEEMKRWYEVKSRYERALEIKAEKQLVGILPPSSFKITITAEIGPLQDGEVIDVRRLTASIVVDNTNEEIYLDNAMKKQIFETIAGSIGYVKGRDIIKLSKADFGIPSDQEIKKLEFKRKETTKGIHPSLYFIIPLLVLILFFALKKYIEEPSLKRFGPRRKSPSPDFGTSDDEIEGEKKLAQIRDLATNHPEVLSQIMEGWLQG
jgi:flagellar biosynthesis/type III secretory pathway M-ring protein FliF/YscJ